MINHHVLLNTYSGIPLSQISVFRVICIYKSVHHGVVGTLVTSESMRLEYTIRVSDLSAYLNYILLSIQTTSFLKIFLLVMRKRQKISLGGRGGRKICCIKWSVGLSSVHE